MTEHGAEKDAAQYLCRHGKYRHEHWCDDHDDHADSAEKGLPVPDRLDSMQSTKTLFSERTGHDDPDWMRPWPFGPVHYSQDWSARTDGRFDAVCGKSPIFWPETEWPEHEVCADCKAWVEEHGTPVPMLYETRDLSPAERHERGCAAGVAPSATCTCVFPPSSGDSGEPR